MTNFLVIDLDELKDAWYSEKYIRQGYHSSSALLSWDKPKYKYFYYDDTL